MNRILAIVFVLAAAGIAGAQELWVGKDGNIRNVDTRDMVIGRGGLYLATRDEVYVAPDFKAKWESIFALPPGENEISSIMVSQGAILVGTRRGLYRSMDSGRTWKNVFKTFTPEKNDITAIEASNVYQKKILICTGKGVFESRDLGDSWADISANLKNKRIGCLALSKEDVYVGGEDGLYLRKAEGSGWDRIYVNSAPENILPDGSYAETADMLENPAFPSGVQCIAFKGGRLYAVVSDAIVYSDDGGSTWRTLSGAGLSGALNYLAASRKTDKLYCATTKGVFVFDKERSAWTELYKGMEKVYNIRKVLFDGEEEKSLWALTPSGLYKFESGRYTADQYVDIELGLKSFKIICNNEPAFKELQRAAMRFADVEPEKIRRWQAESRLRALLPKISFDIDNNSSNTYEIYTSATKDYFVMGPDDISKGFDVSVSWELGDLIWSDDQTNIDVRSRLTTQLRNDVLDDLRRAYYERKRLQFELAQSPPKDLKTRFDKELRIQELTQAIDDLTGNYLSEHMKK